MTDKPREKARADRLRQALRANLHRRKKEASPPQAEADALERRQDRLAPRIGPDRGGAGGAKK
jgi:hypothetical protein